MEGEALYREAIALQDAGDTAKAVTLYKILVESSSDPRYFIGYGVCLQKLGHWTQSVTQLERGIELKPHYCEPDARLFLAQSYVRTNQIAKAIREWRIVEGMPPQYPSDDEPANTAKAQLKQYANRD